MDSDSTILFDLNDSSAERLPLPGGLHYAQWLMEGETIVAYDAPAGAWKIFYLGGREQRTVVTIGIPTASSDYCQPSGTITERTTHCVWEEQYLCFQVLNTTTGATEALSLPSPIGQDVFFSPDGDEDRRTSAEPRQTADLIVTDRNGSDVSSHSLH